MAKEPTRAHSLLELGYAVTELAVTVAACWGMINHIRWEITQEGVEDIRFIYSAGMVIIMELARKPLFNRD